MPRNFSDCIPKRIGDDYYIRLYLYFDRDEFLTKNKSYVILASGSSVNVIQLLRSEQLRFRSGFVTMQKRDSILKRAVCGFENERTGFVSGFVGKWS